MPVELEELTVRELLQLEAGVIRELRRRDLVRTNNKPLGDIAEQIVLAARGGVLEPNSTKSHDVTDPQGRTIQVKGMGARSSGRTSVFSPFRSFDFDTAVFLCFDAESFDLVLAREVPAAELDAASRFSAHVNGRLVSLRQVEELGADVLAEMKSAYARLELDAT